MTNNHDDRDPKKGNGFGEAEFETIGKLICEVVGGMASNGPDGDGQVEQSVRDRVTELCEAFPVYPGR